MEIFAIVPILHCVGYQMTLCIVVSGIIRLIACVVLHLAGVEGLVCTPRWNSRVPVFTVSHRDLRSKKKVKRAMIIPLHPGVIRVGNCRMLQQIETTVKTTGYQLTSEVVMAGAVATEVSTVLVATVAVSMVVASMEVVMEEEHWSSGAFMEVGVTTGTLLVVTDKALLAMLNQIALLYIYLLPMFSTII